MDTDEIRGFFPALDSPIALLDNAGGTQVPRLVADRVRDYMLGSYVQPGAGYETSRRATATVARAHGLIALLMGAGPEGHVALGASTSSMLARLGHCYGRAGAGARSEIVVAESGHEANIGPWAKLGERGFDVRWWRFDRERQCCPPEALGELLGPRTRLLALPHVSNLLGRIEDVGAAIRMAHDAGAKVVVDGVAYAPHRAMDVAAWGADWYAFSIYKVYGPHMAALYGRADAFAEIEGPNHFFVPAADPVYKFELGGVLHEGCAGVLGLADYLPLVAGRVLDRPGDLDRVTVEAAFAAMAALEQPLQTTLLDFLRSKPAVRICGPAEAGPERVPTLSFVHSARSSREIATLANERGLGIRHGHFYAHRLAAALGLDPDDGVVRVSLVHYNSHEEVERLMAFLDSVL
jgi:cysteine desulfurase family protein (TIGR01976 family)